MDTVLTNRAVLEIRGEDATNLLQGLITNDIRKLAPDSPLYAALLTPQGKILHDFLLYAGDATILLDCARDGAADLKTRLSRYRLRARVEIALRDDLAVHWNDAQTDAWRDPRHPRLGWRTVRDAKALPERSSDEAWLDRRLELGIPESADFGSDRMFALDAGLEDLRGISFDKGCYVGQELTARMKHRGTARKRLLPVEADSDLPAGETQVMAAEREVGVITSTHGRRGFATIRLDRLADAGDAGLCAGGVSLRVLRPEWLFA